MKVLTIASGLLDFLIDFNFFHILRTSSFHLNEEMDSG